MQNDTKSSMKITFSFFIFSLLFLPVLGIAQQADTLSHKLDSLSRKTENNAENNHIQQQMYNEKTQINVPAYFALLGSDVKQQITAPFHLTGKDWGKAAQFGLLTLGLSFADEPIQQFALSLSDHNAGLRNTSKYVSRFGGMYEGYVLGAISAYGFVFQNEKLKTATLLATQAYITGALMESASKFITGRQRPSFLDPVDLEAEPKFHGPFYKAGKSQNDKRMNSSFPSGHTTVAFAAATVFAMEYSDRPLVPIISYSAATLIGLSRIAENRHWATDVLVGSALGYLCGRQVVHNYHRYTRLKAPKQKQNNISFSIQYYKGSLLPGLIYTFR